MACQKESCESKHTGERLGDFVLHDVDTRVPCCELLVSAGYTYLQGDTKRKREVERITV